MSPAASCCATEPSLARIVTTVVVHRGSADLVRAILIGVEHLQSGHDFARSERLDLEFTVGDLCDAFAEIFAAAVEGIERLRPACGEAPFDFRHRLRDG